MKTLKLEVGKTYRSRKGEEAKIVRAEYSKIWPFCGDNGKSYNEQGRCYSAKLDDPFDLIEEVTRHTFAIPDGVKKVTVEQVGNRIVVEMVPAEGPKPGDVMVNERGSVYIFKEAVDKNTYKHYCALLKRSGRLCIGGSCLPGRPATPEEAQPLFDALKKEWKRWNPKTMQVEDVPERERIMEYLQGYPDDVTWNHEQLCWVIEQYLKHKEAK